MLTYLQVQELVKSVSFETLKMDMGPNVTVTDEQWVNDTEETLKQLDCVSHVFVESLKESLESHNLQLVTLGREGQLRIGDTYLPFPSVCLVPYSGFIDGHDLMLRNRVKIWYESVNYPTLHLMMTLGDLNKALRVSNNGLSQPSTYRRTYYRSYITSLEVYSVVDEQYFDAAKMLIAQTSGTGITAEQIIKTLQALSL